MVKESPSQSLIVKPSDESHQTWIERPFISTTRKEALRSCEVLFVPFEKYINHSGPIFASDAKCLALFLSQCCPELRVDFAIDDSDYAELHLHGRTLVLGGVVVTVAVAPLVVNIASNYVQRWIDGGGDGNVKLDMTVVSADGCSTSISYDGPATSFELLLKSQILSADTKKKAKALSDSCKQVTAPRDQHSMQCGEPQQAPQHLGLPIALAPPNPKDRAPSPKSPQSFQQSNGNRRRRKQR